MSDQKIYGSRQEALAAMRKFKEATEEIARILGVSTYTTVSDNGDDDDDGEAHVGIIYHEAYYQHESGRMQAVIKPSHLTDIFKNESAEPQAGPNPDAIIIEDPFYPGTPLPPPLFGETPPRSEEPI